MYKKVKLFFITAPLIFFIFLINKYYFSDLNKKKTNISRSTYSLNKITESEDLPLLKNDTNDIIFYNQDIEHKQKKKKYPKFFDLLKK